MNGAVVVGASGGIGAALVAALRDEDVPVRGFARSFGGADRIDLLDEASIAAAAASLAGGPDLVVVATGLLHEPDHGPEKSAAALDPAWLAHQYAVNAIGPALVAKHFLPRMPKAGRCVFAVLSARVGSISDNKLGGWYGYRASKAALNQLVRSLAIEERRRNDRSIVVALHPGTVDTGLSKPFQANVREGTLFTPDRAAVQLLDVIDGLKAPDSGRLFAQIEEIGPDDREALTAVWSRLRALLDTHAEAEERFFYPALMKVGTGGNDAPSKEEETEDAIEDHNDIRDTAAAVDAHEVGSDDWFAAIGKANVANSKHMAEEERQGLTDFRRHASVEERHRLAVRFAAFDARHVTGVEPVDKDPKQWVADHEPG